MPANIEPLAEPDGGAQMDVEAAVGLDLVPEGDPLQAQMDKLAGICREISSRANNANMGLGVNVQGWSEGQRSIHLGGLKADKAQLLRLKRLLQNNARDIDLLLDVLVDKLEGQAFSTTAESTFGVLWRRLKKAAASCLPRVKFGPSLWESAKALERAAADSTVSCSVGKDWLHVDPRIWAAAMRMMVVGKWLKVRRCCWLSRMYALHQNMQHAVCLRPAAAHCLARSCSWSCASGGCYGRPWCQVSCG